MSILIPEESMAARCERLLAVTNPFSRLPEDTRLRLAMHASERSVVAGEMIVKEGDIGEDFYLVEDGALHVLGRAFDGSELVLARFEAGACFGEQALLAAQPTPRTASVRAVTRCRLIVLPRSALKEASEHDAALVAALRETGERQKIIRSNMFRERILDDLGISGIYTIEHFRQNECIFREGEAGDKIYLIIAGRALALRGQGDTAQPLSELLPGQFFGELAILNDAPRAATVRAETELEVVALEGKWFRSLLDRNPRLRSVMASLKNMYILPARGLVTLQSSGLASQPYVSAWHHLADERVVFSIRYTEAEAFRGQLVGAEEATSSARFADRLSGIQRQIHLLGRQIVEIESEGAWAGLGAVFERMLDGVTVSDDEIAVFEASGDLGGNMPAQRDASEIICRCAGVTTADIMSKVAGGYHSVDQIATQTKATLVCGGCIPTVKELLGQGEWTAATCEASTLLAPDIRHFRLRTIGPSRPALPGQHVVVQARIRGRWVERPYTLVSHLGDGTNHELVVRRESDGVLSRWLFDHFTEGGALRLSPPKGSFCLEIGSDEPIVFFAGGIGITPALAIARGLEMVTGASTLAIDHSVSSEEQGVYRDELESLAENQERFFFRLRVTGRDGRIARDDVEQYVSRFPRAAFWICGSEQYVSGVTALLESCKIPQDRISIERFRAWG